MSGPLMQTCPQCDGTGQVPVPDERLEAARRKAVVQSYERVVEHIHDGAGIVDDSDGPEAVAA